ncbi:MAG: hypothetical protein ASARMPRED_002637 [Alectoria sarmentosa]|nr:MAG: hypothetical protein ASARMPRED_002637 [Alectoria sarmentosa]
MASSNPSSNDISRVPTPNPRFTNQASTAADLLASQTVGLVHLSDFRKRRAEALEQKEREAQGTAASFGRFAPASSSASAKSVPNSNDTIIDGVSTPQGQPPKKKRRHVAKGKLSFRFDDEDLGGVEKVESADVTPRDGTPDSSGHGPSRTSPAPSRNVISKERKRLGANANISVAPKAMTKSALLKDAQTREQLRKEFLLMQQVVKATEIIIPFVFYDGTNIPGGACKVKKGDYVWLFLDRSRKVGAELGVGGGEKANSRREWARVGVDDLMLVRGEIIIPHHYELYYFIVNKSVGPNSTPLFDYAATTVPLSDGSESPDQVPDDCDPISLPSKTKQKNNGQVTPADRHLEGVTDDPNFTKVVDRRWYERNKHIFPASVWEEFDPTKDYANGVRKDAEGNAFFFS